MVEHIFRFLISEKATFVSNASLQVDLMGAAPSTFSKIVDNFVNVEAIGSF